MQPGIRVVRGPDWDKKRQDGGEGHVGTIVYVPKAGSSDKNVTVIWDSGRERRYRAGHDGKYDLRVYDNGPAGKNGIHVIYSQISISWTSLEPWKVLDISSLMLWGLIITKAG